jgi:hypothetical protein
MDQVLHEGGFKDLRSLPKLIADASDDELAQARIDGRFVAEDLPAIAFLRQSQYGRGAFGLRMLRYPKANEIYPRASRVAYCLAFRRAGIGAGIDNRRAAVGDEVLPARMFVRFAREYPRYRRYLRPLSRGITDGLPAEVLDAVELVTRST